MNLVNDTGFPFACVAGRLNFPGHSLTLIVKGTFELSPDEVAAPADVPSFPTGDEYYRNEVETQGSLRYDSDFAYLKPRADLLLVGKCYAPHGTPAGRCQTTFRAGDKSKAVAVFGDRRWERRRLRWTGTEPEPFTEMELRYEKSFGGERTRKNPMGKGDGPAKDDQGHEVWPLPNIEDPANLVESPKSRPEPAGFGPLSGTWETRHAKTGTYTARYPETRWPWFPEDFDWSHFNAAPDDMQVEGYLKGNEDLYFENVHPIHAQYKSRLPGLRVRCFLNKLAASKKGETEFAEVRMNLDTLWVDMEAERMVLVWRGWAEVLSEDYEDVQDVFILSEPLEQEPASLEECRRQFQDRQADQEKVGATEPEEGGESASPSQEKSGIDPACLQAETNAILRQMGIDPESLPQVARERQAQVIRKFAEGDPRKVAEMERRELENQMREASARLKLDADHLPPLSDKAKAEQLRFMKELGLKPADIAGGLELGRFWALTGAILPKIGIDPENLDPLIEQARKQQSRLGTQFGTGEEGKAEEAPLLTREIVRERAARGESFVGENLRGLDLSGLELKGIDFSGADLVGAVLTNAKLEAAVFTGGDLTGADLSSANLKGASLAGADLTDANLEKACMSDADLTAGILTGANLAGATLTDALFEKARMAGATLVKVEAKGANFSEADLTGARSTESVCPGADFSKAVLDEADFQGANLREASVDGAVGRKINLADADLSELRASGGCDFSGGIFSKAVGTGSIWEDSDLTGSDFRGSRMEGATFIATCLKQADLSYADMKFGRFNKANLAGARMVRMNLFQGSLEKADLTGADLSGSNMYGVEFLDAVIEGIQVSGTNLKMSKLHKMMAQA
jgi:uncharacterized protein YjbI with pentapeptide repeats